MQGISGSDILRNGVMNMSEIRKGQAVISCVDCNGEGGNWLDDAKKNFWEGWITCATCKGLKYIPAIDEPQRDIHQYFELTYAQYLVIPRSVLQSMSEDWQEKFVKLLDELRETEWYNLLPDDVDYKIELRKTSYEMDKFKWGIKIKDPLADYQRGRRNIFREG